MGSERPKIVLMGSGETAPAMVKTHRAVLSARPPGTAVMLDTPYGFQVNADDLTARTRRYFAESVGHDVAAASWRRRDQPAGDAERALALISEASWLFAGPGSPTYALDQWRDTPMLGAIEDVLTRGGTLVLGSAAAVTAGGWALPVYEIYKVGASPRWVDGLDLLGRMLGLPVAVVPHFDNNEGGTYDTRFCYLGRERLQTLVHQLPGDAAVLGVDEHTAVVFDVATATVAVHGVGRLTVSRVGGEDVLTAGSSLSIERLRSMIQGTSPAAEVARPVESAEPVARQAAQPSLLDEVGDLRQRFDAAIERRDIDEAVGAILDIDDAMRAWSADTLQSDALDQARRQLRAMVVRLGDLVADVRASREVLAPLVEAVLAARSEARETRDFASSDRLRAALTAAGVSVNDTPDGVQWSVDDEKPGPAAG